jgi:hypothetical protein
VGDDGGLASVVINAAKEKGVRLDKADFVGKDVVHVNENVMILRGEACKLLDCFFEGVEGSLSSGEGGIGDGCVRVLSVLRDLRLEAFIPKKGDGSAGAVKCTPVLELDAGAFRLAKGFCLVGEWRGFKGSALPGFELARELVSKLEGTKKPHLSFRFVEKDCGVFNVDRVFAEVHGLDEETLEAVIRNVSADGHPNAGPAQEEGIGGVEDAEDGSNHRDGEGDLIGEGHSDFFGEVFRSDAVREIVEKGVRALNQPGMHPDTKFEVVVGRNGLEGVGFRWAKCVMNPTTTQGVCDEEVPRV